MSLANYRTMTQYEWTPEQARNGKFDTAKRRVAKKLKGRLPRGWSYKIIAPYNHGKVRWEIKMDYGPHPWITIRWRPCMAEKDSVLHYWMEVNDSNQGCPEFDPLSAANAVMRDLPIILDMVQEIFDGLNPDPLMELHAMAKKATASFSPSSEEVEA
jgi:hypothetical protein